VESSCKFRPAGNILHGGRFGFRIGENLTVDINDGRARIRRLTFLRGDIPKSVSPFRFYALGEHHGLLAQIACGFLGESIPPIAIERKEESGCDGGSEQKERKQNPEEYPAVHFGASKR
jgi:hypothetical protein